MCFFTSHVSDLHNCLLEHFPFDTQIPLLHVGPHCMGGNRSYTERVSQCTASPNTSVPSGLRATINPRGNIWLLRIQHKWRTSFQRLAVALVSIAVIEEDSVTSPQRRLSVSENIPCKTHSRRWMN